jgi:hypothetical protein
VYVVPPEPTEQEKQSIQLRLSFVPPFGVIVTRPEDMALAREIHDDVLVMFNSTSTEAMATAWEITRAADQPVAVIAAGEEEKSCSCNQTS